MFLPKRVATLVPREKELERTLLDRCRLLRVRAHIIRALRCVSLGRVPVRAANIRYYLVEFDFQSRRAVPKYSCGLLRILSRLKSRDGRWCVDTLKPVADAYDRKTLSFDHLSVTYR